MTRLLILFFVLVFSGIVRSQLGGNNTYTLLQMDNTARVTMLGGGGISVIEKDLGLAFQNPSLLDSNMHNTISLNFVDYFAGVKYGFASYAWHFGKWGTWGATMQVLNYGKFKRTDEFDNDLGQFVAGEYLFAITGSVPIDTNFRIGLNLKVVNSVLDVWSSFGVMFDFSALYFRKKELFSAALVMRNVGWQLKPYTQGNREPIPFEIRAGVTKRLKHAPFRFSLTYDNMQRWNLIYFDPSQQSNTSLTGLEDNIKPPGFFQKFGRHLVLGTELLLGKNFYIGAGFNYRRRKELATEVRPALSGFSFGLGVKIKKIDISYARSNYHRAGGLNQFTVSLTPSEFKRSQL